MNRAKVIQRLRKIKEIVDQKKVNGKHRNPGPIPLIRKEIDSLLDDLQKPFWKRWGK